MPRIFPFVYNLLINEIIFLSDSQKTGLISRFLRDSDQYKNYQLKREILILLHKIFSIKKNPFVSKKLYIDEYIGLCYLQFIKFYCSYALDTPTLDLSYRHLKILIDFAAQMNEKIKMRFFQLHTMDFLVREVIFLFLRANFLQSYTHTHTLSFSLFTRCCVQHLKKKAIFCSHKIDNFFMVHNSLGQLGI